jgi:hypothetical protein
MSPLRSALMNGASTWPAANRAIYMPVYVQSPVTVTNMALIVSVQSGNLDVGIYSETGTRLVSSGSTAVGAAGLQVVDITNTTLATGVYYFAVCVDNTTASFNRSAAALLPIWACGVQQEAVGAVTLPATATFANPASAYFPFIVATTASGVI